MSQIPDSSFDGPSDSEESLLADFGRLWADADELWDQHQDEPAFRGYVSADYTAVYDWLSRLQGTVVTFLEWGSGLGVVTIMASRMGFEAYGIEAEPGLVKFSEELADVYGPEARFAQGSFVPEDFEVRPEDGDDVTRTIMDAASAYDELDMELRDFDLIYAFPWPDEHTLFHNMIRKCGRRESLFLSYHEREGVELVRFDDDVA